MSSDQVARLAATIEVLTSAVNFLVAERVAAQPEAVQEDLLDILQRAFSTPPRSAALATYQADAIHADLSRWMPIVAEGMMQAVRRQIGPPSRSVTHIAPGRAGAASEVAERTVREHARGAVAHFENGRAVA